MCELNLFQDNVAASLIDFSLSDMKKEPNKKISLANEEFKFNVRKERIHGSSGTKSLRSIVLPQSIVVIVFRGNMNKTEWASIHKAARRIRGNEE
ncbi:hypothetical protein GCK72_016782 [Caenorhabditis remanei]|uniref:Uncharacterized protein n=1 Tax=Caenorhabditis remanei TaxID=31234 RepID=A0A6A5G6E0_CAERE|nr:hypothetical protein GCK72_016782 [Caenorhabditis remanei]KAF1750235.1 hypothetical protein GCK72_016782 [Caenorhabditis remanei]